MSGGAAVEEKPPPVVCDEPPYWLVMLTACSLPTASWQKKAPPSGTGQLLHSGGVLTLPEKVAPPPPRKSVSLTAST